MLRLKIIFNKIMLVMIYSKLIFLFSIVSGILLKMATVTEGSMCKVCAHCFEKIEISKTEEGEVVICEKCKTEWTRGDFARATEFGKNSDLIEGTNELLIKSEIMDESGNTIENHIKDNEDDDFNIAKSRQNIGDIVLDPNLQKKDDPVSKRESRKKLKKQKLQRGTCEVCQSSQDVWKQKHCQSCR